jgi:DNA-binding transcriptional ArsR family regulator
VLRTTEPKVPDHDFYLCRDWHRYECCTGDFGGIVLECCQLKTFMPGFNIGWWFRANFRIDTPITSRLLIASVARGLCVLHKARCDLLFKALGDRTRRAIFEQLCREGEQTVRALTAQAGVSQPAVSKHLGVLRRAGLVLDRQDGRQTHYSARAGALAPLSAWTRQMNEFWQSRFDDLEDLLKRMDQ